MLKHGATLKSMMSCLNPRPKLNSETWGTPRSASEGRRAQQWCAPTKEKGAGLKPGLTRVDDRTSAAHLEAPT